MWLKVGAELVRRGTLDFPAMAIAIRDMMQIYKICLCWLVYIYTIYICMCMCVFVVCMTICGFMCRNLHFLYGIFCVIVVVHTKMGPVSESE